MKKGKKQEKKVAQVINDVDYHAQHGTMTENDRKYIYTTINRSRSPASREEENQELLDQKYKSIYQIGH